MNNYTENKLIADEGFRSKPYLCTNGVLTFGHGLTYITEEESREIVQGRIKSLSTQVDNILKQRVIRLSDIRKSILVQMAFQMGVNGVLLFKNMWKALEVGNYELAAVEMLDSKWAKSDSPARAERLAKIMREGKDG